MAGSRDYFPRGGTGLSKTSMGRTQDSLLIFDEQLAVKQSLPTNTTAAYSGANTWNAGQWLRWNNGKVEKVSNANQRPVGIACVDRNADNDETVGSKEVTVLTGPSGLRFMTDQIETGISPVAGTLLYVSANGNLTTSSGGGPIVAEAVGPIASDGFLECILRLEPS